MTTIEIDNPSIEYMRNQRERFDDSVKTVVARIHRLAQDVERAGKDTQGDYAAAGADIVSTITTALANLPLYSLLRAGSEATPPASLRSKLDLATTL